MTVSDALTKCAKDGGAIVPARVCSGAETRQAKLADRFFIDEESGLAFVIRPGIWRRSGERLIRDYPEQEGR